MKGPGQRTRAVTERIPGTYQKNFCAMRVVRHRNRDSCEELSTLQSWRYVEPHLSEIFLGIGA